MIFPVPLRIHSANYPQAQVLGCQTTYPALDSKRLSSTWGISIYQILRPSMTAAWDIVRQFTEAVLNFGIGSNLSLWWIKLSALAAQKVLATYSQPVGKACPSSLVYLLLVSSCIFPLSSIPPCHSMPMDESIGGYTALNSLNSSLSLSHCCSIFAVVPTLVTTLVPNLLMFRVFTSTEPPFPAKLFPPSCAGSLPGAQHDLSQWRIIQNTQSQQSKSQVDRCLFVFSDFDLLNIFADPSDAQNATGIHRWDSPLHGLPVPAARAWSRCWHKLPWPAGPIWTPDPQSVKNQNHPKASTIRKP